MKTPWQFWPWTLTALTVLVLYMGVIIFLGVRDNHATQRCENMHGQTWDSGRHCVLGDPTVVNTR